jgi:hypothetical protein
MIIHFKDRQIKNIIIIFSIGLLYWILLVLYREIRNSDIGFLRINLFLNCNGWCISHFLQYLLLGYCAPKYWKYIILIGICYEVIEIPLNKISRFIDSKLIQDSFVNTLGVLCGVRLYKLYPKKIDLYSLLF